MSVTRAFASEAAAAVLAAEACCDPRNFLVEGVHLSEIVPGREAASPGRRFPQPEHILLITGMGTSVVVSATMPWMSWVAELFQGVSPGDAFSPRVLSEVAERASRDKYDLHGPYHYGVTCDEDLKLHDTPSGYSIEVGGPELVQSHEHTDWPNAIPPRAGEHQRRVDIAAVAIRDEAVVAMATATDDSDVLTQIGIDVHPGHRRRGLGAALTSQVADNILRRGRVPYYGAAADNTASLRTARSAGFELCWTAAFTKEGR